MLNKKIKFFILGTTIVAIFLVVFFTLKNNNKNTVLTSEGEVINVTNKMPIATSTSVTPADTINNTATNSTSSPENINSNNSLESDKINRTKFFIELKEAHPEYSAAQLEFYNTASAQEDMNSCRGRSDESACISAVAFITRFDEFCGEIKERASQLDCVGIILDEKASPEIANCQTNKTSDLKAQCLIKIFNIYKQVTDCSNLKIPEVKKECESVAYYQTALRQQDNKTCDDISNEYLKIYCSESLSSSSQAIVDEPKDTDGDGLSDQEELNKYFTNPLVADTDGDVYLDGAEVKSSYNPCGEGPLPTFDLLPAMCSKFKK